MTYVPEEHEDVDSKRSSHVVYELGGCLSWVIVIVVIVAGVCFCTWINR